MTHQKGFTVIELLVAATISVFVLLAIYALFDQGRWLHLAGDKRANIQNNARQIMETMERDLVLIGFGVPRARDITGSTATLWAPAIFNMTSTSIGFTGDVDGGAMILGSDPSATSIPVHDSKYYEDLLADVNPVPVLLIQKKRRWHALSITAVTQATPFNTLTTGTITSPATFSADESEVFTMESVSYRWVTPAGGTADANNNGDCDSAESYPFIPDCVVQRAEFITNNPDARAPGNGDWNILGTNVLKFVATYHQRDGTPATTAIDVERIGVNLTCRDRGSAVGELQEISLQTEVVVRNEILD